VAERVVILGALPRGRAHDLVNLGRNGEFPVEWLDGNQAMSLLADRVEGAAQRAREHQSTVADLDVISDGLLQEIIEGLEEQLWMLRAHLQ
jgi:DNA-binding ferritin-like protein